LADCPKKVVSSKGCPSGLPIRKKLKGGYTKMFKFKKVASVLASTVMLSSTVALAAAANYPAPFVKGGAGDVAVVYSSTTTALSDLVAVTNIVGDLQVKLAEQTATVGGTVSDTAISGEATPLFSGGSKLYLNDSISGVKSSLTKENLPTLLADETFSGNQNSKVTQSIILGSQPRINFGKMPTDSDSPDFGITLSTTQTDYIYNATASFGTEVDLTSSESEGEELTLFGQTYTVSADTTGTKLVLLKSAVQVDLADPGATTSEVKIGENDYTIELVSASDTDATIKVTDADGNSQTKTISESDSKKIQGVTVAIITADETTGKISTSLLVGADKLTFQDGMKV
jgi:hypothetical protein